MGFENRVSAANAFLFLWADVPLNVCKKYGGVNEERKVALMLCDVVPVLGRKSVSFTSRDKAYDRP